MKFKRIFLVVMDSVGAGELPDAADYGDKGSNTIAHIAESQNGLNIPNLEKLGYANITNIKGLNKPEKNIAYTTKLGEASIGKDTMTGHWEMMGLKITEPFKTFTDTGFPQELLDELSKATGRGIVGNKSASGTDILDELGEHQIKTGDWIVYTSADSVLQIAANEEIIPVEELWAACKKAREITMKDEWKVGRIIARPFVGQSAGNFKRTSNRHDYALKPFDRTTLNELKDAKFDVISLGKINDIFDTEGITRAISQATNEEGMNNLINLASEDFTGLAFLNLVDFDALYGHRRDVAGYAKCLEEFDQQLGEFMTKLNDDDLLLITADHGNDPVHQGTDHTREYVPLFIYANKFTTPSTLEVGESFANIGATIAENFGVKAPKLGTSYYTKLN